MPRLNSSNIIVVATINKYIALLVSGMGGVSAGGIRLVIELEEPSDSKVFTQKVLAYLSSGLRAQNKEC